MKNKLSAILILSNLLCIRTPSFTQNLVPNPSFEQHSSCPQSATVFELKDVKFWFQPSGGSTDYYNRCDKSGPAGVPTNNMGFQLPYSGNGYIGMILYSKNDYREYFSTKLDSSLIQGRKYCVKLFVSLANKSHYAISDIQILFTSSKIQETTLKVLKYTPQLSYSDNKPIADTLNWTEVSWIYTADGSEQYLTIGNFNSNKKSHIAETSNDPIFQAYYYVDDICIAEMKSNGICNCAEGK
ncbi:MAG TPA: hypothetical protein VK806_00095 [Bacteroidia bacterium]|jgi:OOP family OmpA-OmpF porin|nr:hypothetical protein [Bacteroidia bacterium]